MTYSWKDADHDCHYYLKDENGLIVGQVHKIAHTKIFVSVAIIVNEEKYLVRYIALDFAKTAISNYWDIQGRTLLDCEYSRED